MGIGSSRAGMKDLSPYKSRRIAVLGEMNAIREHICNESEQEDLG